MRKPKNIKKINNLITDYAKLIGFGNWDVAIKFNVKDEEKDCYAQTIINEQDKELLIKIYTICPKTLFKNVLIHEFIHARIEIMNIKINKHKKDLEEECVNDITKLTEGVVKIK